MTSRGYGLNIKQSMSYDSDTYVTDDWVGNCVRTIKRRGNGYGRRQEYKSFRGDGPFIQKEQDSLYVMLTFMRLGQRKEIFFLLNTRGVQSFLRRRICV